MAIFTARDMALNINARGYIDALTVCGRDIARGSSPLITLCGAGALATPSACDITGDILRLTFSNGSEARVQILNAGGCLTIEALSVPEDAYALIFGPIAVTLDEEVGEVLGVAQGEDIAFGVQALSIKSVEGVPEAYAQAHNALYAYKAEDAGISVGGTEPYCRTAARLASGGTLLHLFCKDRSREERATVLGARNALVTPLKPEDADARIQGAKIALFGCARAQALDRIGQIEIDQGLPHPMLNGEWAKTSRAATKSYLISEFTSDDIELVLDKAELAGFDTIYHSEPFKTWGHFEFADNLAADDADFKRRIADKAAARGIKVGVHSLTNFTTVNDSYVTPHPHTNLLKLTDTQLLGAIGADDTELIVKYHACFERPLTLNAIQLGDELLTYRASEATEAGIKLTQVTRGAFGTRKAAHAAGDTAYLLWDYPYATLFPDILLQDEFADRLAHIVNRAGVNQISFDGLEGCTYTGHDIYACVRFLKRCYDGWERFVLNDASRLYHFGWHICTRMNWGEPWGADMRNAQVQARVRNQAYFKRNLFPRMLGWFLIRLADRKHERTCREDLEWALAKAAGFDAGYALVAKPEVLKRHGGIDELMTLVKHWDALRHANAFTEAQKARLREPETEWRLEKGADSYTLFPLLISPEYICSLAEMQPGQRGGADFLIERALSGGYALYMRVEGEGAIYNPQLQTARGAIKFPCKLEAGQYLHLGFDGKARITDINDNMLARVNPMGELTLSGDSITLAFSCEHERLETPDVIIRFISRGEGEIIAPPEEK